MTRCVIFGDDGNSRVWSNGGASKECEGKMDGLRTMPKCEVLKGRVISSLWISKKECRMGKAIRNVAFRIRTATHDRFRREGNDLHTTVTITLASDLTASIDISMLQERLTNMINLG
ncbi:Uncharacterized protein Fot_01345 [Forsythia ovata]|uniref:Uncharacterized protein n=1 Tax=Forsythia ovata TaxID=205694 RepID=A0ABD1X3Q0_9LAMI